VIRDKEGNDWYKVGLHIHTTLSDGHKTPEEVVAEYKAQGYDAIALTDHWVYGPGGNINGMMILPGCEYNSRGHETISGVMHLVGIGMQYDPGLTREYTRQQIVDGICSAGGVAVLAHPAWSLNTVADAQALNGVALTEVYNAVSEAHQSVRAYSENFIELCANAGIYYGLLATDDAHYYDGSDSCKGWTMIRAAECTPQALLQALRNGDFYASQGPELYVKREGNRVTVACSGCSVIAVMTDSAWSKGRVLRGENLTEFSYELKETEHWFRVQVWDEHGKCAWSNVQEV